MQEQETVCLNDGTRQIRRVIADIKKWVDSTPDNPFRDDRHVAMVLTKLEEAELLSLRMVKHDEQ